MPDRYEAIPASRALMVLVVLWLAVIVVVFVIWPPWHIPDQSGPARPHVSSAAKSPA